MKELSKEAKDKLRIANLSYFLGGDSRCFDYLPEILIELTDLIIHESIEEAGDVEWKAASNQ